MFASDQFWTFVQSPTKACPYRTAEDAVVGLVPEGKESGTMFSVSRTLSIYCLYSYLGATGMK